MLTLSACLLSLYLAIQVRAAEIFLDTWSERNGTEPILHRRSDVKLDLLGWKEAGDFSGASASAQAPWALKALAFMRLSFAIALGWPPVAGWDNWILHPESPELGASHAHLEASDAAVTMSLQGS